MPGASALTAIWGYITAGKLNRIKSACICWITAENRGAQRWKQSFYTDQTSVLNSALVGLCVAQLARYAWETWRDLTGNQKLKLEQLIERSDESITNKCAGAMDDRMDVVPHSQATRADDQRGYSWTCPIDIGANGMRTVMSAYTVAYRRDELNA